MSRKVDSNTADVINVTDDDIDEDMKLTREDYLKILHHYQPKKTPKKQNVDIGLDTLKNKAHNILGNAFCRCIRPASTRSRNKRIDYDTRRISLCTKSIFNNRGLKRHGFLCRNKTNKLTSNVTKIRHRIKI